MTTEARLGRYYEFDGDILESVARAASSQNGLDVRALADQFGMADGAQVAVPAGHKHPVEFAVFKPDSDYDSEEARVLYTPLGNPVNESTIVRGARLFASDPTKQLVVIGNVSDFRRPGVLPFGAAVDMIRETDLEPAVRPSLRLLRDMGIRVSEQLGYSFGADKAAAASAHALEYDIRVSAGVFVEPAGVAERGLARLLRDFVRSGAQLETYVRQADSKPLDQARSGYNAYTTARWFAGLARLSNIAVSQTLSHPTFEGNVAEAIQVNGSDFWASVGWGELSELSQPAILRKITDRLQSRFGFNKVRSLKLEGMHHAGGDDVDLHAAIMLQGLRKPHHPKQAQADIP